MKLSKNPEQGGSGEEEERFGAVGRGQPPLVVACVAHAPPSAVVAPATLSQVKNIFNKSYKSC